MAVVVLGGTVVVPANFGWVALVPTAWTAVFAPTGCPMVCAAAVGCGRGYWLRWGTCGAHSRHGYGDG